jgi:hypothetical protein
MSAAYVREQFRTVLAGLLPAPWAYVESINNAVDAETLPPQWFTVEFTPADDQRISLGEPGLYRETGAPLVLLFTEHQIGDAEALSGAELVRAGLVNFTDPTGHLRVLACGPPTELDGGDFRGAWYGQSVDVRYQYDRFA